MVGLTLKFESGQFTWCDGGIQGEQSGPGTDNAGIRLSICLRVDLDA